MKCVDQDVYYQSHEVVARKNHFSSNFEIEFVNIFTLCSILSLQSVLKL